MCKLISGMCIGALCYVIVKKLQEKDKVRDDGKNIIIDMR